MTGITPADPAPVVTNIVTFPYDNRDFPIRRTFIAGVPHYFAADICDACDIGNVSAAVARVRSEHRGTVMCMTVKGPQRVTTVTAEGVQEIAIRSRKPPGKALSHWLTTLAASHSTVLAPISQTFMFEGDDLRLLVDGETYWVVAKDAAVALGYANPRKAIFDHCPNATTYGAIQRSETERPDDTLHVDTRVIPEADLYALISASRLPSAVRFKSWLFGNVLPAIRRTGAYVAPTATLAGVRAAAAMAGNNSVVSAIEGARETRLLFEQVRARFPNLGEASLQVTMHTLSRRLIGEAIVPLPVTARHVQLAEIARQADVPDTHLGQLGKLVTHLKTAAHGELRVTRVNGKDLEQWHWTEAGRAAVLPIARDYAATLARRNAA